MFYCGNFSNQEEEHDIDVLLNPCTTPKKSRKASRDSKNPYADRGLDKFSALLAELEGKKQKIYTQKGSEDISFVRFVYSGSDDWKPIVVKKQENTSHVNNGKDKQQAAAQDKHTVETSTGGNGQPNSQEPKSKSIKWEGGFKFMKSLNHPFYYLPLVMLLILLLLAVYGRSFAILCTSLGWYLVPVIKERSSGSSSTSEKAKNKKDHTGRLSEKNMASNNNNADRSSSPKSPKTSSSPKSPRPSSSPKSVLSEPAEKPSGKHSHRKSW